MVSLSRRCRRGRGLLASVLVAGALVLLLGEAADLLASCAPSRAAPPTCPAQKDCSPAPAARRTALLGAGLGLPLAQFASAARAEIGYIDDRPPQLITPDSNSGDRFYKIVDPKAPKDQFGNVKASEYSKNLNTDAKAQLESKRDGIVKAWAAVKEGAQAKLSVARPDWQGTKGFIDARMGSIKQPLFRLNKLLLKGESVQSYDSLVGGSTLKELSQLAQNYLVHVEECAFALREKTKDPAKKALEEADADFQIWAASAAQMIAQL